MTLLLFLFGLVLLTLGGELLVRGAARLAALCGISPLVIGLTVVAFGTSAPELAVSVMSAFAGQADLALGNVVGSNICNVLLILGASALFAPLIVHQQLIRLDVPLMIVASLLLLPFGLDGVVDRLEGGILFAGVVTYTIYVVRKSRREGKTTDDDFTREFSDTATHTGKAWLVNLLLLGCGTVLLVLGSRWLVDGAVAIARYFGLSELVIGLTIVAIGTSLPELATSVVAAIRGERDIAVGNVVGSNLFNILSVLGLSSLVAPKGISVPASALSADIPVMIAVAVACLPVFFVGYRINRWEGALFLGYYVAYLTDLLLAATGNAARQDFRTAMFTIVIPLTIITLAVITVRAIRRGNPPEPE
jgi:cation:H+ antiporter